MFRARQTHIFKSKSKLASIQQLSPEKKYENLFDYAYMTHEGVRVKNEDRISVHLIEIG